MLAGCDIKTLMQRMGLGAIYLKPNTSCLAQERSP